MSKSNVESIRWCQHNSETDDVNDINVAFAQSPMLPSVREAVAYMIGHLVTAASEEDIIEHAERLMPDIRIGQNAAALFDATIPEWIEKIYSAEEFTESESEKCVCPLCNHAFEAGCEIILRPNKRTEIVMDLSIASHMIAEHDILIPSVLGRSLFGTIFQHTPRKRELHELDKGELLALIGTMQNDMNTMETEHNHLRAKYDTLYLTTDRLRSTIQEQQELLQLYEDDSNDGDADSEVEQASIKGHSSFRNTTPTMDNDSPEDEEDSDTILLKLEAEDDE